MKDSAPARRSRPPAWVGRVLPALIWAGIIFCFSARPDLPHAPLELLDLLLRKGCHMAEYAVLAVLIQRALPRSTAGGSGARLALAWLLTVLYAVTDEWHQSFVPGRTAAATDVLIDGVGALLGLLVSRLVLQRLSATERARRAAPGAARA